MLSPFVTSGRQNTRITEPSDELYWSLLYTFLRFCSAYRSILLKTIGFIILTLVIGAAMIVGLLRWMNVAKQSRGIHMVSAIVDLQYQYAAQHNTYLSAWPNPPLASTRTHDYMDWQLQDDWKRLGFAPNANNQTYLHLETQAGDGPCSPSPDLKDVCHGIQGNGPWFWVLAHRNGNYIVANSAHNTPWLVTLDRFHWLTIAIQK